MPDSNVVSLNVHKFELVADRLLPKGKRGWTRSLVPTQGSNPSVQREVEWHLSGVFGLPQETPDGYLGQDYNDGCETRYDGLLTVAAKENAVELDSLDPVEGDMTLPFTIPASLGGFATANTSHIIQDRNFLVFGRGQAVTVVDPSDMSVVATYAKDGPVAGMTVWKNHGVVSYGALADMEKVGEIGSSGATFTAVTGQRAKAMTVGPDRWWGVKAASDGTDENKVYYSLDDLAAFSNAFQVGDDKIPATGLGTAGPYLAVGNEVGASSFTDLAKSQRLLEAVKDFRSSVNGRSIDTLWGWTYIATKTGLFAVPLPSLIANPVGPESYTNFDGAIDGYPTAVKAWKDSLWVAYLTTSGDTYILRGMFGSQTAATGQPLWYPFAKLTATECDVIGGTSERTNPTLIVGTGNTASYFTLGRRGRDIDDANYRFSTAGGTWYGTRMMRGPGMHKSPRFFEVYTENCSATKTIRLDLSVDGAAYVTVGTITSSGHHFVRPSSAGAPLTTVNGHTYKLRVVFTNDSETAPPRIIGPIGMVYDERPDHIEQHSFVVRIKGDKDWTTATDMLDPHEESSPIEVYLPGEGTKRYGTLVGLENARDVEGDGIQAAVATVNLWSV